ncbi:MAG: TolC family protein, partial [Cytophagaceae bacterium]|nr:TolC family protein [Cytophagaceae bacterium]
KAKLNELRNAEVSLNYEIVESNIVLNTLMNRNQDSPFYIDSIVELKPYAEINFDTLTLQRSDIAVIDNSISAMKLNQKYASFGRKPDFTFRAEHGVMFAMPNQYTLMGSVNIPIVPWASKSYKSEVKSMGFRIEEMRKDKESLMLSAKRSIGERHALLKSERIQLENLKDTILPYYEKNYQASLLSYRQNTLSLFVLLDSWEMLLMKRMEYLEKYYTVFGLQAELEYESQIK